MMNAGSGGSGSFQNFKNNIPYHIPWIFNPRASMFIIKAKP